MVLTLDDGWELSNLSKLECTYHFLNKYDQSPFDPPVLFFH